MDDENENAVVIRDVVPRRTEERLLPTLIRDAGGAAPLAYEEFFQGQIRNPFTRKAYRHSVRLFSDWCETHELAPIRGTPADVGRFLDSLVVASPTKKLHLAALRRFFEALVMRHVLILNPALSVRSERTRLKRVGSGITAEGADATSTT